MHHAISLGSLLSRTVFLVILGFVVVVLSGPILALVSMFIMLGLALLPFALVGLAVWIPLRLLLAEKPLNEESLRGFGRMVRSTYLHLGHASQRLLSLIPRIWHQVVGRGMQLAGKVWRVTRATLGLALELSVVTLSGVAVGAIFGVVSGYANHEPAVPIQVTALAGGVIAALVGVVMTLWEKWTALRRVAVVQH